MDAQQTVPLATYNAVVSEVEHQRNIAFVRCAEHAARIATLSGELASAATEIADLRVQLAKRPPPDATAPAALPRSPSPRHGARADA